MCGSLSLSLFLSLLESFAMLGVTRQNKYFKVDVCSVHTCLSSWSNRDA